MLGLAASLPGDGAPSCVFRHHPPATQLKYKLNISRAEAIRRAVAAVAHAATLCKDIEFSAEDAGRSDRAFLADIIGAVIEAGATTINVPDTVRAWGRGWRGRGGRP